MSEENAKRDGVGSKNLPIPYSEELHFATELFEFGFLEKVSVADAQIIASPEFAKRYGCLTDLIRQLNNVKDHVDANIKELVKENYSKTGENSVYSESLEDTLGYTLRYTYVPGSSRISFDSKSFKEENPDLYKKYAKISSVSDSLRISKVEKKQEKEKEEIEL